MEVTANPETVKDADLLVHDAIANLIPPIQQSYRQHYRQLTDLRWLL